ncbi:Lactose-binding lectin l-2 [Dissostichus eleginoides]|uniref:Lactose-binding lectin l-2 n=1 Tax=Dissostichus eleginoides TaxID=100907 RepID=A0AAD9EW66_DISEL|nr:Lactose-binding lectin l-2 [Dissostichus eleginoides]
MFWYSFNNRCYKYIAADMDWADAEFHCVSEGANLVSIHSQGEENFVKSLIKNFDPAEGYTWIGLRQPDNAGNEDCGHTNSLQKWNDFPCSKTIPSVCASRITCV